MADSSLEYDQTIKMQLYAETGVPEYWIADIRNDCLITHSDRRTDGYRGMKTLARGSRIAPQLLPECEVPVDALLP
jgi:Uma2 family endonuclease